MVTSESEFLYPVQPQELVSATNGVLSQRLEVQFTAGITLHDVYSILEEIPANIIEWIDDLSICTLYLEPVVDRDTVLRELEALQEVAEVGPSVLLYPCAVSRRRIGDDRYAVQLDMSLAAIGADISWGIPSPPRPTIAVIDSGYDSDHPDLLSSDIRAIGISPLFGLEGEDTLGHGTNVLGIMAASEGNGGIRGLASAAAKFLAIETHNRDGGTPSPHIAKGILLANKEGARIINMSFGSKRGSGESPALREACFKAYSNGCVLVAGTGNNGIEPIPYPAAYDYVLAVGGGNLYGPNQNSNVGRSLVYASYYWVTTKRGGGYDFAVGGTSLSCAAVSALAAWILLPSAHANWPPDDVYTVIREYCNSSGYNDEEGFGVIDFFRATFRASETAFPDAPGGFTAESQASGIALHWDLLAYPECGVHKLSALSITPVMDREQPSKR
ncbi:S8 family serine peptidase, partial [Candidatus Bipolaricaulota bacterium]